MVEIDFESKHVESKAGRSEYLPCLRSLQSSEVDAHELDVLAYWGTKWR